MYPVDIDLAIARVLSRRKRLKKKWLDKLKLASGHELDELAYELWLKRLDGETDVDFRQRILEL